MPLKNYNQKIVCKIIKLAFFSNETNSLNFPNMCVFFKFSYTFKIIVFEILYSFLNIYSKEMLKKFILTRKQQIHLE